MGTKNITDSPIVLLKFFVGHYNCKTGQQKLLSFEIFTSHPTYNYHFLEASTSEG